MSRDGFKEGVLWSLQSHYYRQNPIFLPVLQFKGSSGSLVGCGCSLAPSLGARGYLRVLVFEGAVAMIIPFPEHLSPWPVLLVESLLLFNIQYMLLRGSCTAESFILTNLRSQAGMGDTNNEKEQVY